MTKKVSFTTTTIGKKFRKQSVLDLLSPTEFIYDLLIKWRCDIKLTRNLCLSVILKLIFIYSCLLNWGGSVCWRTIHPVGSWIWWRWRLVCFHCHSSSNCSPVYDRWWVGRCNLDGFCANYSDADWSVYSDDIVYVVYLNIFLITRARSYFLFMIL